MQTGPYLQRKLGDAATACICICGGDVSDRRPPLWLAEGKRDADAVLVEDLDRGETPGRLGGRPRQVGKRVCAAAGGNRRCRSPSLCQIL